MNIKKISLVGSGFKGCSVTYLRAEEKNGRPFVNEVIEKRKHPIHLSLETMFKDLRFYLVDIAGLLRGDEDKMTKDYIIQETEVTGVEFDAETFIISGEKQIFLDKTIKLKTCKVDEKDNYEHFETVQKLIESIVEETKEYLAGTKKVDDVEVTMRFIKAGKHKEINEETVKGWTPEQLKEFATQLLENQFGSVVMHNIDLDVSTVDVSAANEELLKAEESAITISEESIEIPVTENSEEEIVIPVPVKKSKKEKLEAAKAIMGNTLLTSGANGSQTTDTTLTPIAQPEPVIKPAF